MVEDLSTVLMQCEQWSTQKRRRRRRRRRRRKGRERG